MVSIYRTCSCEVQTERCQRDSSTRLVRTLLEAPLSAAGTVLDAVEDVDASVGHRLAHPSRPLVGNTTEIEVVVRSPFRAKHYVAVQYMARWMKCPLPPPPLAPSPSLPPCPQTPQGRQGGQGGISNITGKGLRTAVALSTASCSIYTRALRDGELCAGRHQTGQGCERHARDTFSPQRYVNNACVHTLGNPPAGQLHLPLLSKSHSSQFPARSGPHLRPPSPPTPVGLTIPSPPLGLTIPSALQASPRLFPRWPHRTFQPAADPLSPTGSGPHLRLGPVVAGELEVDVVLPGEQRTVGLGEVLVVTDGPPADPAHRLVAADAVNLVAAANKNAGRCRHRPRRRIGWNMKTSFSRATDHLDLPPLAVPSQTPFCNQPLDVPMRPPGSTFATHHMIRLCTALCDPSPAAAPDFTQATRPEPNTPTSTSSASPRVPPFTSPPAPTPCCRPATHTPAAHP